MTNSRTNRSGRSRPRLLIRTGRTILVAIGVLVAIGGVSMVGVEAQSGQGATAVPLILPTAQPTATPESVPVAASGTPLSLSIVSTSIVTAEALDAVTGTNVRQGPSADASTPIIGKILKGNLYPVIGKNGDWLEIYYDKPVANTPGWVYSQIVKVTGDLNTIPVVDPNSVPTIDPGQLSNLQTASYLTQTPGAIGSATAQQASATGVIVLNPTATAESTPGGPLGTFTFPPPFVVATLMPSTAPTRVTGTVPPILPIAGFAALGILGLIISGARRN